MAVTSEGETAVHLAGRGRAVKGISTCALCTGSWGFAVGAFAVTSGHACSITGERVSEHTARAAGAGTGRTEADCALCGNAIGSHEAGLAEVATCRARAGYAVSNVAASIDAAEGVG